MKDTQNFMEKAMEYETFHKEHGRDHTWSEGERLEDLIKRASDIKAMTEARREQEAAKPQKTLLDRYMDDDDDDGCLICHL